MWAQLTDDDLIRTSDLIVLGEWAGQASTLHRGQPVGGDIGVVTVTEVLKGLPGTAIALVAVASARGPRSSSDITFKRGDRGLWLLRRHAGGPIDLFAADHPQRFVSSASGEARIATLRRMIGR